MTILWNGMTISELIREHYSIDKLDVKINNVEKMLISIATNKKVWKRIVVSLAISMFLGFIDPCTVNALVDATEAIGKINSAGKTIWALVETIGYWVILATTGRSVIKEAMMGNKHNIGGEVMKGMLQMGALYYLPIIFDLMASIK